MKNIFLLIIAAAVILFNGCDSSNEPEELVLSGVWEGEILNIEDDPIYFDVDFKEVNGTISGFGRVHRNFSDIIQGNFSGIWDGNKIQFVLTNVADSIQIVFSGTGNAKTISGNYSINVNLLKTENKLSKVNDGGFSISKMGVSTSKIAGIYTYNWQAQAAEGIPVVSDSFRVIMVSDSNQVYMKAISGKAPYFAQTGQELTQGKIYATSMVTLYGTIIGDKVHWDWYNINRSTTFHTNGNFEFQLFDYEMEMDYQGTYSVTGPE